MFCYLAIESILRLIWSIIRYYVDYGLSTGKYACVMRVHVSGPFGWSNSMEVCRTLCCVRRVSGPL